jgi:outer membrane protein TolC
MSRWKKDRVNFWRPLITLTKSVLAIILALFFGAAGLLRAEELRLTPENLSQLLQERHPALNASNRLVDAAKTRTGYWRRSFYPHVNALVGAERYETGPYAVDSQPYGLADASVNLFRGGRDRLEEAQRRTQVRLAAADREVFLREELEKVRGLYWQLVAERERIYHIDALLAQGRRIRQAAERRVSKGLTTNTDVLAIDLYNRQLEEQKESAMHEAQLIYLTLAIPLNISSGAIIVTSSGIPHEHLDTPPSSKTIPPTMVRVQAQQEISEIQRAIHSRWWMPALDAYGQYGLYTRRDRDFVNRNDRVDWAAGLRAKFALFDGGTAHQEAKASAQETTAYRELANYKERSHQADIATAVEEMRHTDDLIEGSKIFLEKGDQLLRQTLNEYDRGVRNSQDVLAAFDRLATIRHQHLERRLEYQKVKARWLALLGL